MEYVNTLKLIPALCILILIGCKEKESIEINVYEVGNVIVYDTLGSTTNETLKFIYKLDSLIDEGETNYMGYSWTKGHTYSDSLTSYNIIFTKEKNVFDFQVFRLNNQIVLIKNPESTDYKLLKHIKCIGGDCKETAFSNVLKKIDSLIIPPLPTIIESEADVLDADSISIDF